MALLTLTAGCRKEESQNATPVAPTPAPRRAELIFPDALRVADESVNTFVRDALHQSTLGEYESFRSLWTARQDPISRGEFEEGWQAVDRIEVRGLEKVLLEAEKDAPEQVYVLLVEVSLDPQRRAGKREPVRQIVLMLVPELDRWKIAAAPKPMRDWIKQQTGEAAPSDSAP